MSTIKGPGLFLAQSAGEGKDRNIRVTETAFDAFAGGADAAANRRMLGSVP